MTLCRGCAGTGVGQHVGVREAQLARLPFFMKRGPMRLNLMIEASEARARLRYHAPLALVLREIDERKGAGWEMGASSPDPAWTCSWCHGTGELQLSVASMERAVSA